MTDRNFEFETNYDFRINENHPEIYRRFVIIEKVSKKIYRNTTDRWIGYFPYEWSANHTVSLPSNLSVAVTDLDILSYGC